MVLSGDDYDGWWIATMQVAELDIWGEGYEFQTVYRWIGPEINLPPMNEKRMKDINNERVSIYPYLWWQDEAGWQNNGYVGAAEVDDPMFDTWGWYYESGRNEVGTRWKYTYMDPTEMYFMHNLEAYNIGYDYSNTQSVSFVQVDGSDGKLTMHWWLVKGGFWFGERQCHSWYVELDLDDLL